MVRLEGAHHLWRKIPPRELSIDLVADERLGRAIGGGVGRADGEAIDTCTRLVHRGNGHGTLEG